MLSVARTQWPCPQCRRQVLRLLKKTVVQSEPPAIARCQFAPYATAYAAARLRRLNPRCFSTTRPSFQEPPPELPTDPKPDPKPDPQPEPESQNPDDDIELFVRQTRRAFGDTLPKGYLNDEEYKIYTRLYGPPLRETHPTDVGMPIPREDIEEEHGHDPSEKVVLRETEDGVFEEIVYETDNMASPTESKPSAELTQEELLSESLPSDAGLAYIHAIAKNQREFDALLRLQKDFEAASLRPSEEDAEEEEPRQEEEEEEEQEEEEEEEEIDEEDEGEPDATFVRSADRAHEFSRIGHWRTNPRTLQLPKATLVQPIIKLLDRTDIKHVAEAAENAFGGPGLPFSVATPSSRRNAEQKPIPLAAGHHKMSAIEADAFLATMVPGMYSSVMSVLVEIRKRLGSDWMTKLMSRGGGDGPRVLDVGTGGAALAAWEQVLRAEWNLARAEGKRTGSFPAGKKTAVVGSEQLRQRVSRFLHDTTFLPRLPDYLHSGDHPDKLEGGEAALPRKQFDIIIASHQMMALTETFRRKALLNNLWEMLSPEGGILVVVEKGHPRGFEAVADVRARLLDEFIVSPNSDPRPESIEPEIRREREPGMIIAPCTNHTACPMYLTPGLTPGRKDFCHFSQRFIRPPFLQRVLGAAHRNHEDIDFSFVAVQRGTLPGTERSTPNQGPAATADAFTGYENSPTAPDPLSLPRNILSPLKRTGHVTLDLCTPDGTLERWTIPKSFSKQAYRDARKAKWGDLWALGAKTRVSRRVRLGKPKVRVINVDVKDGRISHASEAGRPSASPRRTKRGRRPDLMEELGLAES